jgi:putative glutamine amidotransferase
MRTNPGDASPPSIVVTLGAADQADDPTLALQRNARYLDAVTRAGGVAIALDEHATQTDRARAFATMNGLLLSGGADIHPARYGREVTDARATQPARDQLEAEAWAAAGERALPVLGICRGLQAINVFSGGTLIQHVDAHESPSFDSGPVTSHPVRIQSGTRLAQILGGAAPGAVELTVNSYHHQAVRPEDLAATLIAVGSAPHVGGDLVEAVESVDPDRFVVGVQCHPERTESTPQEFERLFEAFVDAARGA